MCKEVRSLTFNSGTSRFPSMVQKKKMTLGFVKREFLLALGKQDITNNYKIRQRTYTIREGMCQCLFIC